MNHLANAISPYLQQHAANPVDWYPWGEEAILKARLEKKPILLSIGYAACHWCHVMAHESFEDAETAKLMNALFINIKVDREERPDLDKVYQTAHYFLTQQSGGWPLTLFLNPEDLLPFFSGTYFPREKKYQVPTFKEVLKAMADVFQNQYNAIQQQNADLHQILNQPSESTTSSFSLNDEPIQLALQTLERSFDKTYGGFGNAPKFPRPAVLEFLLAMHSPMATFTLQKMAEGGIYDQLEGGFFRYSVDAQWHIPHFEKMLYDNAQLLQVYAKASREHPLFAEVARKTAEWIIHKMQSPQGGYYSSLDADTDRQEGKYYAWNKFEIEKHLTNEEYQLIRKHYGLDQPANFENLWHFYVAHPIDTNAKKILEAAKEKLLAAREKRTQPTKDQKILTSWNSLTIKAMAIAGQKLQEPKYINSALHALKFIREFLWTNNQVLACYQTLHKGFLDDYAFLLDATLTLLEINQNAELLSFATHLAENLLQHFEDKNGGFFFISDQHEQLIYRPKTMMDEAIPSGNGIAVLALLKLSKLTGENRYKKAAEKTLQVTWPMLLQHPAEHASLLLGLKYCIPRLPLA